MTSECHMTIVVLYSTIYDSEHSQGSIRLDCYENALTIVYNIARTMTISLSYTLQLPALLNPVQIFVLFISMIIIIVSDSV